ncbi:MAG: DUF1963 domain-containing protein [Odoribacteraceae bacterium]|jgi:uncharacterized protein YwqG|nr:DUF1963 domain-containing protein [Odoribacteraceae bacterium]
MGFIGKLFGNKEVAPAGDVAGRIVELFEKQTSVETVRVLPSRESCAPWESKLGGVPYLPPGFAFPRERREGREEVPLRFLAQLNFWEMPALEGFPTRGLAQFYVGNDEQYGMDYETLTAQKAFRVVFHEEVSTDAEQGEAPAMPEGEAPVAFPLEGEARLRFRLERTCMGGDDFRFDGLLLKFYNEVTGGKLRSLDRVPEGLLDEVYERVRCGGHRVGGYPSFSQLDPRAYHDYAREHTALLLQLASGVEGGVEVSWRGGGFCHFLARPDDLAAGDFAEVAYSWDCY